MGKAAKSNVVPCADGWAFNGSFLAGVGHVCSGESDEAFLEYNGTVTYLGTLPGDTYSIAWGVNSSGTVVGCSFSANTSHAFAYASGAMSALSTGSDSCAKAINDSGDIVGNSGGHLFLYHAGNVTDLGVPYPTFSFLAINASDQIVGSLNRRAFLYSGGTMSYLDSMVVNDSAFVDLTEARGINDNGQIAATAYVLDGGDLVQHPFLLTPVETPEPSSVWIGVLGLCGLWVAARRYRGNHFQLDQRRPAV